MNFKTIKEQVSELNDTRACVPIALSLLSGDSLSNVREAMYEDGVRSYRQGAYLGKYRPWFENKYNVKLWDVTKDVRQRGGLTVKSLTNVLNKKGSYLVVVRGHVLAFVNGKVEDWTENRHHRVHQVYQVLYNRGCTEVLPLHGGVKKTADHITHAAQQIKSGICDQGLNANVRKIVGSEIVVFVETAYSWERRDTVHTIRIRVSKKGGVTLSIQFSDGPHSNPVYDMLEEVMPDSPRKKVNKANATWGMDNIDELLTTIKMLSEV